jgi:hypothetical protein
MSTNVFSRAYLQGRTLEYKRQEVSKLIDTFLKALLSAADSGRTSYLFDMSNTDYINQSPEQDVMKQHVYTSFDPSYSIPLDELIQLLKERFPECNVTYDDIMVDSQLGFKIPKKGILIDWS